ncbi:hypothetical protein [Rhodococcus erythropolis]|uniref:hypothetical protein n=1 Tax=Rhodococcus erythropolis TaxID=1833 RepID=UPI0036D85FE4
MGEVGPFSVVSMEYLADSEGSALVTSVALSDRDEVQWVKEHSGLTWDQLGKVFGVSRRAVHLWANGGRMNELNAARLRNFSAQLRELGEFPADEIRAQLFSRAEDGLTLLDRLRIDNNDRFSIGRVFEPEEMVGVLAERDISPRQPKSGDLAT